MFIWGSRNVRLQLILCVARFTKIGKVGHDTVAGQSNQMNHLWNYPFAKSRGHDVQVTLCWRHKKGAPWMRKDSVRCTIYGDNGVWERDAVTVWNQHSLSDTFSSASSPDFADKVSGITSIFDGVPVGQYFSRREPRLQRGCSFQRRWALLTRHSLS